MTEITTNAKGVFMLEEDVRKLFAINEHRDERGFSLFFGNFPVEKFSYGQYRAGSSARGSRPCV